VSLAELSYPNFSQDCAPSGIVTETELRIGLFSQWYEPEPTIIPGILARELARRHHSVKVLTGFPNYPEGRLYQGYRMASRTDEMRSGVAVRRVALYPSHSLSTLGRLTNYASFALSASVWGPSWFKEIDALWVSNSPPTVGLPTWLIKARHRPRVVLHIMDLWPESLIASGFGQSTIRWPAVKGVIERWLSMTYKVADAIACTSHKQIELLISRGVAPDKLSYVPIWVDESIFHPSDRDEALAEQLGVTGKTVLLYAGAIGEPQSLDTLVEVCSRLRDEQSFHCLVAGTGGAEARLRARVEEIQLTNISFLGRWAPGDMTRLMSIGDIHFVSLRPDPLAEIAMPSKVPATLACAKPMIVAARGDAAGVVERSGAGWTCEPGNADQLETAIRSGLAAGECTLREMGQKARNVYEAEFAVNIGVERVERLLVGGPVGGNDAN
jgi:colanic acid biosynthesis glycosyl transferase WcaI